MNDVDVQLDRALGALADAAPHDPQLAGTVRRRSFWRRLSVAAPVSAAVAVVLVVGSVLLFRPASAPAVPGNPAGSACRPVRTELLPTWARMGFSDPMPTMPLVTSDHGLFVGILFGTPLAAPPSADHNNKILWVARPADPGQSSTSAGEPVDLSFRISGTLEGSSLSMHTAIDGGPGPSIIDVPAAGCWTFHLVWGSYTDTIALAYSAPTSTATTGAEPPTR